MRDKKVTPWQVGASFIGTVIGAGFATGQEIMQFFTSFGVLGMFTLVLSGVLFSYVTYKIFYISTGLNTSNYKDFIYKLCGNKLGLAYDFMITLFLFLGTSIMFSGSGAIFEENLGIPRIIGILVIAVCTLLIVLQSLNGILKINSIIVPILLSVTIMVLIRVMAGGSTADIAARAVEIKPSPIKSIFYLLFYCSYNMILSLGLLTAFSKDKKDLKILRRGAAIGGMGLMLLSAALNICLLSNSPEIFTRSIPMLYIVRNYGPAIQYSLMLCIWCAVFSTAIANVFSLSGRLTRKHPKFYTLANLLIVVICIPMAMMDFKSLISFFYPLFGALSIYLVICVLWVYRELRQGTFQGRAAERGIRDLNI